MKTSVAVLIAAATMVSAPLAAQGRGRNTDGIPPGQRPPPGMCRVWIAGVPPGRQPTVTDCVTARLNAPANSRVIYGGNSQGAHTQGAHTQGAHTTTGSIFERRVLDKNGNSILQRVRRNPDGTFTILGTRRANGRAHRANQDRREVENEDDDDRDDDRNGGDRYKGEREDGGRWKVKGNENGKEKERGKP